MSTEQRSESIFRPIVYPSSEPKRSGGGRCRPAAWEAAFFLFQPDILLPAQYYGCMERKDQLEPERKLMLAVLEDAINCFRTCLFEKDPEKSGLFHEAEGWIMEEDSSWLYSFDNICGFLGIDPKYLRAGLMRWKEGLLAQGERVELSHLDAQRQETLLGAGGPDAREAISLSAAGY